MLGNRDEMKTINVEAIEAWNLQFEKVEKAISVEESALKTKRKALEEAHQNRIAKSGISQTEMQHLKGLDAQRDVLSLKIETEIKSVKERLANEKLLVKKAQEEIDNKTTAYEKLSDEVRKLQRQGDILDLNKKLDAANSESLDSQQALDDLDKELTKLTRDHTAKNNELIKAKNRLQQENLASQHQSASNHYHSSNGNPSYHSASNNSSYRTSTRHYNSSSSLNTSSAFPIIHFSAGLPSPHMSIIPVTNLPSGFTSSHVSKNDRILDTLNKEFSDLSAKKYACEAKLQTLKSTKQKKISAIERMEATLQKYTQTQINEALQLSPGPLSMRLSAASANLDILKKELQNLRQKIQSCYNTVASSEAFIDHLENEKISQSVMASPYSTIVDTDELSRLKSEHFENYVQASHDVMTLEKTITTLNSEIKSSSEKLQENNYEKSLLLLNTFQNQLRNNPDLLYQTTLDEIESTLLTLNTTAPAKQSIFLRMSLLKLERGLANIKTDNNKFSLLVEESKTIGNTLSITSQTARPEELKEDADLQRESRTKYYQTCYLLWELLESAKKVELNVIDNLYLINLKAILIGSIEKILLRHYLTCFNAKIPSIDLEESFEFIESEAYGKAVDAFQKILNSLEAVGAKLPKELVLLKEKGELLRLAIDDATSSDNVDYKFKTILLNSATDLLNNPSSHLHQQKFRNLATYIDEGKSSTAKKLIGAILMFVGAVMVAAAILGKFASLFAAAPITTPLAIGGGVMFVAGLCLFNKGKEKGLSKASREFMENADKVKHGLFSHSESKEEKQQNSPFNHHENKEEKQQNSPFSHHESTEEKGPPSYSDAVGSNRLIDESNPVKPSAPDLYPAISSPTKTL